MLNELYKELQGIKDLRLMLAEREKQLENKTIEFNQYNKTLLESIDMTREAIRESDKRIKEIAKAIYNEIQVYLTLGDSS